MNLTFLILFLLDIILSPDPFLIGYYFFSRKYRKVHVLCESAYFNMFMVSILQDNFSYLGEVFKNLMLTNNVHGFPLFG